MTYQSTVSLSQGFGVVGEVFDTGPRRAQSYTLNSVSAANNVFGRGFSYVIDGTAQVGNPTGTAAFVGILANPKAHALYGNSTDPLAPSLTLPNFVQADLMTMGSMIVSLPATATVGDLVVYDNTTGALTTIAPGASTPVGKSPAYAFVDRYSETGGGLAVITLQPTLKYS